MKLAGIRLFVLAASLLGLACAEASDEAEITALINRLQNVAKIGVGYSAQYSGSVFLPDPESQQIGTLVLGAAPPAKSKAMEGLVRKGVAAIPFLLKHLDDTRKTKLPVAKGMIWTTVGDEFDFNSRVRKEAPKGVNLNPMGMGTTASEPHQITVGDLCFVALGQIVNRHFNATRYQPTGGVVISSPSSSKTLCEVARAEYRDFDAARHRQSLIDDFNMPEEIFRRVGASRRIAFYYPDAFEKLALQQLATPVFNMSEIYDFLHEHLYRTKDGIAVKPLIDDYVAEHGSAARDGIELQLYDDLRTQEADEVGGLTPPLKEKFDARRILIQAYGTDRSVKANDKPYVRTWSNGDESYFIEALPRKVGARVDEAVHAILAANQKDDLIAMACVKQLSGKSYDDELRALCERKWKECEDVADKESWKAALDSLKRKKKSR